jgi:hypothetical protein
MQTNCLLSGPAELRENSGISWMPETRSEAIISRKESKLVAPAVRSKKSGKGEVVGCHVKQFGGSGVSLPGKKGGDEWKEKSKW